MTTTMDRDALEEAGYRTAMMIAWKFSMLGFRNTREQALHLLAKAAGRYEPNKHGPFRRFAGRFICRRFWRKLGQKPRRTIRARLGRSKLDVVPFLHGIGQLCESDRRLLTMRYGLGGQPPQALETIGQELGCSATGAATMVEAAITRLWAAALRLP